MAWTKQIPKSHHKIEEAIGHLIGSLENLHSEYEHYTDNAQERGDHAAADRLEEILDIIGDAINGLTEAKDRLSEWTAAE